MQFPKCWKFWGVCAKPSALWLSKTFHAPCMPAEARSSPCCAFHLKLLIYLEEVSNSFPLSPTCWHIRAFQRFALSFSCLSLAVSVPSWGRKSNLAPLNSAVLQATLASKTQPPPLPFSPKWLRNLSYNFGGWVPRQRRHHTETPSLSCLIDRDL